MSKTEFLKRLKKAMSGFPKDEMQERLAFYAEMIDDRMEEGLTEDEAVAQMSQINEIVAQSVADIPLTKLVREKIKPERRRSAGQLLLIILGFPLWFPLLISAVAVVLSLYVVLWALLISLWAIEVSLCVCAAMGIVYAVINLAQGSVLSALSMLAAGCFCAGAAILLLNLCKSADKGILKLTKKLTAKIKSLFI